ncbi:MAG: ANTAR domain-containing protein [Oscillospiraceae bacterium]|nr:ANTAR domain-containing protein [Oscillospiraceae bacterium]
MRRLLIAFAGQRSRAYIAQLLREAGMDVSGTFGTGLDVLMECRSGDVVVCGDRLLDMTAEELSDQLPERCGMVLLAEEAQLAAFPDGSVMKLTAPVSQTMLAASVREILTRKAAPPAPPKRTIGEQEVVNAAKEILMSRQGMTETEAHRYLQKQSMNSGLKMTVTAARLIEQAEASGGEVNLEPATQ